MRKKVKINEKKKKRKNRKQKKEVEGKELTQGNKRLT